MKKAARILGVPRLGSAVLCAAVCMLVAGTSSEDAAANSDIGAQIRFPVEKYKLENGLTVLLNEDHSAPLISYQTWFRVGSKHEEAGYTGIAHLFEHMMFKGAKRYTGVQFETILQSNGASNNAFTTHDYTGYYENLPSAKLETIMDLESDRMESLQITEENLKSEREVVKEERRFRVDNSPQGSLREATFQTVYRVHPYLWPVIGYMTDLNNISLEKCREFFKTYYSPNNAVLVISGDFNSEAVKKLVEKYYGKMKSAQIPNKVLPAEPLQNAQRLQTIERDVQNITFNIAYHSPKAGEPDSYALDLLANILGRGPNSRLYKRMIYKDQVANSAIAFNSTLQDSGTFEVMVSLKPGIKLPNAQKAVMGEIWRPRSVLVSEDELNMAKKQIMKGYIDSLKTIHGKAESLALNEILFGDYEQLFKDLDYYSKVTAEDIRRVAAKYLSPEQSTVVILRPGKSGQAEVRPEVKKSSPPATKNKGKRGGR